MSYSILVLDDEMLIAEGIAKLCDWSLIGCHICATAYNGTDGKKLIDQHRPDIVISDIRMPGLSGLELAKYGAEKYRWTKFIILTAYGEFEYAHKAIRYGVVDYILKPIDSQNLIASVKRAVESLTDSVKDQYRLERISKSDFLIPSAFSSAIILDIAKYGASALHGNDTFFADSDAVSDGFVACVKLYNLPATENESTLIHCQKIFFHHFDHGHYDIMRGSDNGTIVYLCRLPQHKTAADAYTQLKEVLKTAAIETEQRLSVICNVVLGGLYHTFSQLHTSYAQCMCAIASTFFSQQSGILDVDQVIVEHTEGVIDFFSLMEQVTAGNVGETEKEYNQLCQMMIENGNVDTATHIMHELYRQVTMTASKVGMVEKPAIGSMCVDENFAQMQREIKEYILQVCGYICKNQSLEGRLQILIDKNYHDPSFSLAAAADMLGINSTYLSRLFKKSIGKNFLDYLIYIRLERARHLLLTTDLRVNEVAAAVGFCDERYFGQVLKKKLGFTPIQYRTQYKS